MKDEERAFLVRAVEIALLPFTDRASGHARAQVVIIKELSENAPYLPKEECIRLFWKGLSNPPGAVPLMFRDEAAQHIYNIYNAYLKEQERINDNESFFINSYYTRRTSKNS